MEEKTFVMNAKEFNQLFSAQFNDSNQASMAWEILSKPVEYPCVVVKSCGKYIYVYLSDLNLFKDQSY